MADDDQNLVSEIKITGAQQATDDIKKLGDEGSASFDKLAASAKKTGDAISKSTSTWGDTFQEINKKLEATPAVFSRIQAGAAGVGTAMRSGVGAVVSFGTAITGVVAAGALGIVGIAKFASVVTGAAREVNRASDAQADLLQQQKKNNQQQAQSVASAAQYQSQLRQLNASVANGKIGFEEYAVALQQLNDDYRESQRVQAEVQAAQDAALEQNQKLERAAANRANLESLNQMFGTTLTQSLIRLGNTYDRVKEQANQAFGPVIAGLIDKISSLVDNNAGAISKFMDNAAASMQKFFEQNGPAIDKLIKQITDIGVAFVKVVTGIVIPAFVQFMSFLDKVAATINKIFGTDINGAFLAVVLAIGVFSGALSGVVTVIGLVVSAVGFLATALTPLGLLIAALVIGFTALATSIDWTAFGQRAIAAGQAILNFFTSFPANLQVVWTAVFEGAKAVWDAIVAYVLQVWQGVVDFFTGLVDTVKGIFTSIGQAIQDAFNSALNFVVNLFTSWAQKIMSYIQPIIDALNKVKALLASTSASGSSGAVNAASGGHIRGPGTSTSDSIPAWLSNNEFVVRAKSVAKYGVGFLRALNAGKIDLGKIAGYAMGGLVSMPRSPSLSYATGGPVTGGGGGPDKILHLTIGGETFAGLLMPDDVANSMTRFAVARNSRSAGRRPSWVGGKR